MEEKKKILFVINTLGRAGAENALLELLSKMDRGYDISLFVLSGQGELVHELPEHVTLVNKTFDDTPVLGREGSRKLIRRLITVSIRKGALFYRIPYFMKNALGMLRKGNFSLNRLSRILLSDTAERLPETYDLAVAYLEGGASFYVDSHVHARKKAAFIHVDYNRAGCSRSLDQNCYLRYDRIFAVSSEVKDAFLSAYPECCSRTEVFQNLINREKIIGQSKLPGGFTDGYKGFRILTVGRLYAQKALEMSVAAMHLLRKEGLEARWYVLGEGEEREHLEQLIGKYHLEEDFLLLGAVENPYPYYAMTDIYVHASRYEGKSMAVREAQILGCAIIVSDCSGNREQVRDGVDGLVCELSPEGIKDCVLRLYRDVSLRKALGQQAAKRPQDASAELHKLYDLI